VSAGAPGRHTPPWITWTAVGLVILGAFLRLHDLGAMEFK
jgi:hypothetical protein